MDIYWAKTPVTVGTISVHTAINKNCCLANQFYTPCRSTQWYAPRCRSINLLKLSPRSQIIPPRPINEQVFYPGHKKTLSPVMFGKIGGPHWNRVFSVWSQVLGLILELWSRDSMLRVPRWIRDILFISNSNLFHVDNK